MNNDSRGDTIDPDVPLPGFLGRGAREADDGVLYHCLSASPFFPPSPFADRREEERDRRTYLTGRIGSRAAVTFQSSHTRRTHDARVLVHPLQFRPYAVEDTLQVHIHDGIPVFIFGIHDALACAEDTGEVCGASHLTGSESVNFSLEEDK